MYAGQTVKVVIPAMDEAPSIALVVGGLKALLNAEGNALIDEVVVADNGSVDATAELARAAGARVVDEPQAGYGRACLKALSELGSCEWVLFCDGDNAFYSEQALDLLEASANADLVIGSRVLGNAEQGALTPPQRFGNHLAAFLVSKLWQVEMTDLGPFRLVRQSALQYLDMQDKTFGWTVEMQIKAIQYGLTTVEVPVHTRRRLGVSKISGTLRGTIGAGIGILSMIAKLCLQQSKSPYRRLGKNV